MNGYTAADMSTAAANGHAEGYQAGYSDAVKAVEAGKPAAAQEAVAWAEGYASGVIDERTSDANIGVAGFGAKIDPARANPYLSAAPAPVAAAPESVALRTAMETLEQIATAPDDKGAKFNAASCVAFLTTQGAAGGAGFVMVPVEPTEQQIDAGIEQVQAVLDALGADASAQTLALVAYDGMLAACPQGVK